MVYSAVASDSLIPETVLGLFYNDFFPNDVLGQRLAQMFLRENGDYAFNLNNVTGYFCYGLMYRICQSINSFSLAEYIRQGVKPSELTGVTSNVTEQARTANLKTPFEMAPNTDNQTRSQTTPDKTITQLVWQNTTFVDSLRILTDGYRKMYPPLTIAYGDDLFYRQYFIFRGTGAYNGKLIVLYPSNEKGYYTGYVISPAIRPDITKPDTDQIMNTLFVSNATILPNVDSNLVTVVGSVHDSVNGYTGFLTAPVAYSPIMLQGGI